MVMALKEKGYPCSVWDEWSRPDKRYKKGECERLWNGFRGTSNPVKAGTIIQMAKDRGWTPFEGDGCLDWNDVIEYDGISESPKGTASEAWKPTEDLIKYLELLFKPDEMISSSFRSIYSARSAAWIRETLSCSSSESLTLALFAAGWYHGCASK